MLTSDLVKATRRGDQLVVKPLAGKQRLRAHELAETYLGLAQAHAGSAQHELRAAWSAVDVEPREAKLAAGLQKLVEDGCEFEAQSSIDPRRLRSDVFRAAVDARRACKTGERFARAQVLERVAAGHGLGPQQFESSLYSDLRAEHRLLRAPELSAEQLLARYDLAQLQAVLLRAVKVTAQVSCASPSDYREIFRKLKFRRLLFQIQRLDSGSHRIEIDGPFSLFESVTKYGLQLALLLPTLLQATRLELSADVRWGKARTPLRFSLEHTAPAAEAETRAPVPHEVESLLASFDGGRDGWSAEPAEHIFDLPGVGLCVPDLRFRHGTGAVVFLEVLGYWSRDAVWRRIELVQRGLPQKLLFAASQRLRVSEAALDDHPSGALYVYKGSLSPRAIVDHLERLRQS
jgi:predicted nuclease of restriction endonuclease-like RecB superfamily